MKKLFKIVSIGLIAFVMSCAGSKKVSTPSWYMNVPNDPNFLFAPASATSQDMDLAIRKAIQTGRAEIARQIEAKLEGLVKSFTEEVGRGTDSELLSQFTDVNKTVTSQVLSGSKPAKQEVKKEGEIYRAYVLMQLPLGQALEAFMKQMKQRENMYTRFRATQAYKELEKEVEKYEKYKKEQMQQLQGIQ